ncbi:MAG: tetratricopeptide repeat protein [Polyangia bacterium]|jgi:tetratricopeptide (TPR) repeat protein
MPKTREFMRALALLLVWCQALATTPAWARNNGEIESARAERSQGTVAVNLGRYDEAVEHFSRAYSATQDPVLLFSLAQAYRLGGKADKALAAYSSFLRAAAGAPKYRGQIERAAAEIESITSFLLNRPVDTRTGKKPAAPAKAVPGPADQIDPPPVGEDKDREENARMADRIEPPPLDEEPGPKEKARPDEAEPQAGPAALAPPALVPKPDPSPSPALDFAVETRASTRPTARPLYKKWWVWTTAAVVLAGVGGAALWWYTRPANQAPPSTYGAVKVLP